MKTYKPLLMIGVLIFILVTLIGCSKEEPAPQPAMMMNVTPPANLDLELTRPSLNTLYTVTLSSQLQPLAPNQIHNWRIHLASADGQPIESATFLVDGGMPQHGHGLPTEPQVTTHLGGGDYLLEGMKFNMGGWWELKLDIDSPLGQDSITFNIVLP